MTSGTSTRVDPQGRELPSSYTSGSLIGLIFWMKTNNGKRTWGAKGKIGGFNGSGVTSGTSTRVDPQIRELPYRYTSGCPIGLSFWMKTNNGKKIWGVKGKICGSYGSGVLG